MLIRGRERMNLQQLKCALAVAKNGSINRAARELLVSQPYMSTVIKELEKEMGFQIFRRTHVGIEPTELGAKFLGGAQRIISELDYLHSLKEETPVLKVVSYFSPYFMKCFLSMRKKGASHEDSFLECTLPQCFRSLAARQANLALICYMNTAREHFQKLAASYHFELREILPDIRLHVIMRKGHPLSDEMQIPLPYLRNYPFVYYSETGSFLKCLGLDQSKDLIKVSDRGSYFDAVLNSDALAVLSLLEKGAAPREDLCYLPLCGTDYTQCFACVTRQNYQLNPREKKLLRYIREHSILG